LNFLANFLSQNLQTNSHTWCTAPLDVTNFLKHLVHDFIPVEEMWSFRITIILLKTNEIYSKQVRLTPPLLLSNYILEVVSPVFGTHLILCRRKPLLELNSFPHVTQCWPIPHVSICCW
jgi:hypothetical protein